MATILTILKTTAAAATIAVGLAAAPALAQDPSFNFSIGNGNSSLSLEMESPQGGNGTTTFRHGGGGGGGSGFNLCLSNRDVIRGIRDYGFQRVEVTDSSRRRAEVIGRWGRWDYLMNVNKCTGDVRIVDRFRRGGRGGIGLQFNFN
jgi:hypothetical protein